MRKEYIKISNAEFEFHNVIDLNKTHYLKVRENNLHKWFEKISWIHVNPSVDTTVENANMFVSKTESFSNTIEYLSNFVYENNKSLLLFRGVRGSGKTFIQNYFLNTETRNMNKRGITWIRVDVAKIYAYNDHMPDSISFLEYLWAQVVFVYIRYSQLDKNIDGRSYDSYDSIFSSINDNDIFDCFENDNKKDMYIKKIRETKQYSDSLTGKPFKHIYTECIAKNIIRSIKNNGNKLLLFIDGVDNVDFSKGIREDIQNSVLDFYNINMDESNQFFYKMVFAVRTELDIGYKLRQKFRESRFYGDGFIDMNIDIDPISIKEYLTFLEEKRKISDLDENVLNDYIKFSNKLPNIIENELKKLGITFSKFDILRDLYENDFREMNASFLSTFIYLKDYFTSATVEDNVRQRRSFNSVFEIMDTQGFICLESIFKNGLRYGASAFERKYTPPYRNLGFINIFNPTEHNRILLNPLLSSYILRYLSLQNNFEENIDVLYELAEIINGLNMIKEAKFDILEVLLESNYICYAHDTIDDNIQKKVKLTTKGSIALQVTYKQINVFHSNIYGGLQVSKDKLPITPYAKDGRGYFNAILGNIPTYITFLEYEQIEIINKLKDSKFQADMLKIDLYNTHISEQYSNFYLNYSKYKPNIVTSDKIKLTIDRLLNNFPKCEKKLMKYSNKEFINFIKKINISPEIRVLLIWKFYGKKIINMDEESLCDESIYQFIENIEDSASFWNYIGIPDKDRLEVIIKDYETTISESRHELNKVLINLCKHMKYQ